MGGPDVRPGAGEKPSASDADEPTEPDPTRLVLSSLAAGVLAFVASAGWRILVFAVLLAYARDQHRSAGPAVGSGRVRSTSVFPAQSNVTERALENPLSPLLLAPVIETLLFLVVYNVLERVGGRLFALAPFMVVLALLSWLLHGAGLFDVGQALGFAVLAFLYFRTARAHGLPWAYFATTLAHMGWNSIPFAIYFIRN